MLLNQLTEIEKTAFISLSYHAAMSNNIIDEAENVMLIEYCKEMNLPDFDPAEVVSMDQIIEICSASEIRSKKIFLLELLGLLHADGAFDEEEKSFLNEWAKKVGLSEEDIEKMDTVLVKYLNVVEELLGEIG